MCNFFSAIVTRDGRVLWDGNDNSHEELVKKHGLSDDKLKDRDFVRVEYTPMPKTFSPHEKDWNFKVDEMKTLPSWFSEENARTKVWAVLSKHLKECHAKDISEFLAELKEMKWFSQSQPPLKKWKMFWGKTRDVARDAARVAAGEVAWDAAWDAALFARCLLVRDKLDKKFLKHAADRMEVWRRGYGLLCDVKEKLYVYGVKNSKPKKEDGTD